MDLRGKTDADDEASSCSASICVWCTASEYWSQGFQCPSKMVPKMISPVFDMLHIYDCNIRCTAPVSLRTFAMVCT